MRKQKKQQGNSEKNVTGVAKQPIFSRWKAKLSTFVLTMLKFRSKLFIWNTYSSAYSTPYFKAYAMFSTTGDVKHLKRVKWLYTPKLTLLEGYANIGKELAELIGDKTAERRSTILKDMYYHDKKLTKLYMCYYVLCVKESEIAVEELKKLRITGKNRDALIKKTSGAIKMIETKLKGLVKSQEENKQEAKVELKDFLQNQIIFRKNGFLGDGDCTVAEYGNASVLFKKEVNRSKNAK